MTAARGPGAPAEAGALRIAVLTANEPLYLPAFFDRFLQRRARDVAGVFVCAPVYWNRSRLAMLRRYVETFGLGNATRLGARVLAAKVKDGLRIGRRRRRFHSVASAARHHGVAVFSAADVNAPRLLEQLRSLGVNLVLSVSCPQIFGEGLLRLPALGCLNLHGSDLPRYRGLAPSFWMLAQGERQAGVTISYVNARIDGGDVAGKRLFPIREDDTLHSFLLRAKREACDLALETLERIEAGTVRRVPPAGEGSYFGWPTREAYRRFRQAGRRLW